MKAVALKKTENNGYYFYAEVRFFADYYFNALK